MIFIQDVSNRWVVSLKDSECIAISVLDDGLHLIEEQISRSNLNIPRELTHILLGLAISVVLICIQPQMIRMSPLLRDRRSFADHLGVGLLPLQLLYGLELNNSGLRFHPITNISHEYGLTPCTVPIC